MFRPSLTIGGVVGCVEVSCIETSKSGAASSSRRLSTFEFVLECTEYAGASVGRSGPLGEGSARLEQ